jgi:hypothetical protein
MDTIWHYVVTGQTSNNANKHELLNVNLQLTFYIIAYTVSQKTVTLWNQAFVRIWMPYYYAEPMHGCV